MAEEHGEATYGLREAAQRLGVSARSVRRYVTSRQLEAHLTHGIHGQEYRITASALEAYVATLSSLGVDRVRTGAVTTVPRTLATREPAMATALEALRERQATDAAALERAWARIAELERELATVQARLSAPAPATAPAPRPLSWRERLTGRRRDVEAP